MTTPNEDGACTCPPARDLVDAVLQGRDVDPCPAHRPQRHESAPAIALNDDPALLGAISRAVGAPVTATTDLEQ